MFGGAGIVGSARPALQRPPSNGCKNKQNIPQIQLQILGESPVVVRCGLQDFQTDPVGATGTGGVWSEKNDSRGSVGPKRKNTHKDRKDNGKEENSFASLRKTRIRPGTSCLWLNQWGHNQPVMLALKRDDNLFSFSRAFFRMRYL